MEGMGKAWGVRRRGRLRPRAGQAVSKDGTSGLEKQGDHRTRPPPPQKNHVCREVGPVRARGRDRPCARGAATGTGCHMLHPCRLSRGRVLQASPHVLGDPRASPS